MPEGQVTASELLEVICALPARAPVTLRTSGRTDLKSAWVRWLADYGTPGYYQRKKPGKWARGVYSQLKSVSMLSWLAEQLGVGAELLKSARVNAGGIQNEAGAAAAFRKLIPWSVVEPRVLSRIRATPVGTPADLRAVIMGLSPASPETDRFSAAWGQRRCAQQEARSVWYRHQKEHWLGWLGEYDGPGAYGRSTWKRSAEFVVRHVVNPQMLIWLAEAVGVDRKMIRQAVKDALSKNSMASMSAAIRRRLPWELMESKLIAARRRSRSRRLRAAVAA